MKPLMYGTRGTSVVISTTIDALPGPDLVIDEGNLSTLLLFVLSAISCSTDEDVIDAAAKTCIANLGRERFR